MKSLTSKLKKLEIEIAIRLATKILRNGISVGSVPEMCLPIKGTLFIDDKKIDYITNHIIVAEGYKYGHSCLGTLELCDLIDNFL